MPTNQEMYENLCDRMDQYEVLKELPDQCLRRVCREGRRAEYKGPETLKPVYEEKLTGFFAKIL